jgi:hypothetical protein
MCYYVGGKNYIYPTRDEMIRQMNPMRGRFKTYESFAEVTFEESFRKEELTDAYIVKSELFASSYIENLGGGKFSISPLPVEAQVAPVFAILAGDYNGDGKKDILLAGNSYATEASTGRYDAMKGLLLAGDGSGNFAADRKNVLGLRADKDVKGLAEIHLKNRSSLLLVANNDNVMEAYSYKQDSFPVFVPRNYDMIAMVKRRSGKIFRHEFYYGSNYLSNSSRSFVLPHDTESITIYDNKGNKRDVRY